MSILYNAPNFGSAKAKYCGGYTKRLDVRLRARRNTVRPTLRTGSYFVWEYNAAVRVIQVGYDDRFVGNYQNKNVD